VFREVCLPFHALGRDRVCDAIHAPTIVFPKFVELGYGEFCTPLLLKQGTFLLSQSNIVVFGSPTTADQEMELDGCHNIIFFFRIRSLFFEVSFLIFILIVRKLTLWFISYLIKRVVL